MKPFNILYILYLSLTIIIIIYSCIYKEQIVVDAADCCIVDLKKCEKCGAGQTIFCKNVPYNRDCGGVCACRKADECRSDSDCVELNKKCLEKKQFASCIFSEETGKEELSYKHCVCKNQLYCVFHEDCHGDFTKLKCKSGEIGSCKRRTITGSALKDKCICIRKIEGGNSCSPDECQAITSRELKRCAPDFAFSEPEMAKECADKVNNCFEQCKKDGKCKRNINTGKLSFIKSSGCQQI